ncbi:hypothetical protein HNQ59_003440 [Chitinivorax tropicus]|uniref:Lipoprotein n=1 Tax=Chitinivorax tropicus TaxID=714531 RepID=A0A840MUU5_9PROT|nr:hypothetical protein [Chitinivorax tropicus]MBB5020126.1 hypothetical protein [Chitinivorax tropicus]
MKHSTLLLSALLVALTGCKQQAGSYQIDNARSFTLQRVKPYVWSKEWDRWLLVSRMPDCQRKHPIESESEFEPLKIYLVEDGLYQIKDGSTVYQADFNNCTLTEMPRKTKVSGSLVGSFDDPVKEKIPFEVAEGKEK